MRNIIPHIIGLSLLCSAPVYALTIDDIPADSRIKILTYSNSDVYTVPTRYGYQTSIVFDRNEEIATVSVGDRSMWQIIPSGNRIFIRPMDDGLSTNMTVITNMREYNFDIKSVGDAKAQSLYVVQFRYPEKQKEEDLPPVAMPRANNVAIPPLDTQRTQVLNQSYSYTGSDTIAPAKVYDDGKKTYVEYDQVPSPVPLPMVAGTEGSMVVANHTLQGNTLIIHTVASGFVLKSTAGDITVYNEQFQP